MQPTENKEKMMLGINIENYISDLTDEQKEKARKCSSMKELMELAAEEDIELSDNTLEAVAGGGDCTNNIYSEGQEMPWNCPECNSKLTYWDARGQEKGYRVIIRLKCLNPSCSSSGGFWYVPTNINYDLFPGEKPMRY